MEVIKYLKPLYSGKLCIFNHITLFSLLGMMVILLNNVAANWGMNMLYFDFFAVTPSSTLELSLDIFFGALISLYLVGYLIKYVHNVLNYNDLSLPNFDFEPFSYFIKTLPICVLWQFYYFIIIILAMLFFSEDTIPTLIYIFSSIMVCIIPFIHLVFVKYVYNFKFSKDVIFPWKLFNYIDKTLGDVILLMAKLFFLFVIPMIITFVVMKYTGLLIKSEPRRLSVYLGSLCLIVYILTIIKFVYYANLAKLVKEKFM